jgi:hypothetical protein
MHERRVTTLYELETVHSLDDLRDMNMALDVVDELAAKVAAEAKKRAEAKP